MLCTYVMYVVLLYSTLKVLLQDVALEQLGWLVGWVGVIP